MPGVIQNPADIAVGTCEHCGAVVTERPLNKAGLDADVNEEIADRTTRSHTDKCGERGEADAYELVLESAASRGGGS